MGYLEMLQGAFEQAVKVRGYDPTHMPGKRQSGNNQVIVIAGSVSSA